MSLFADTIDVQINGHLLVDGATIRCEPGQVVALLGPNGAGKSTLLSALASDKRVRLDDQPLGDWQPNVLARRRGVLRQRTRVPFGFTVRQVVEFGEFPWRGAPSLGGGKSLNSLDYLGAVGLRDLADRSFPTLSGGEKRRAQLARVMTQVRALEPQENGASRYLLLDEPLAGLDIGESARILSQIREISQRNTGVLCVFHDLNAAAHVADHIVLMRRSRIIAQGSPARCLCASTLSDCFGTRVHVEQSADGVPSIRALLRHTSGAPCAPT